jgi:hypothetical protein
MLQETDYLKAAQLLGCKVAAIKAVAHQESGGAGFFKNGKVVIKYEGHIFHHFTEGRFDKTNPTLSYPAWTEQYSPLNSIDQYVRFDEAYRLDPKAAMMATSWGMFQIMGENFSSCGVKNIDEFVSDMHIGESYHLQLFCQYLKTQGLAKYLVGMAEPGMALVYAASFARRYNGNGFQKNHYDVNIAALFSKYSQEA